MINEFVLAPAHMSEESFGQEYKKPPTSNICNGIQRSGDGDVEPKVRCVDVAPVGRLMNLTVQARPDEAEETEGPVRARSTIT